MASNNVKPTEGYSLLVIEIIIIVLNILAVIVIVRFKQKYNPDILIFSLALADLAKTCIPMTMTLAVYFGWEGMQKGTTACDFFGWSAFTTNSGIMMVMTLMAVDRYAAICWPFEYRHGFTCKRIIFAVCCIFVYVSIHSAVPLLPELGVGYMMSYLNGSFCHFELFSEHESSRGRGYSIYILALGVFMLIVVIFCYSRTMCSVKKLMKRQRRMSDGMRVSREEYRRRATTKMNLMFARMMIVMMLFFCFSWLPFLVVILSNLSGWKIPSAAHFWSIRVAVVNSLFNPIIGATMCKPYRMGYKFILCKVFQCCGLCSRIQVHDPWDRSRLYSIGSRGSASVRVANSQQNGDRESGNFPSYNSGADSGIDPDTCADHPGASRVHGNMSPSNQRLVDAEQKQDSRRVRRQVLTRRISFMDDEPVKEENPAAEDKVAAVPRVCTGPTEGILKSSTPSKNRRILRSLSDVISNTKSPLFVRPFQRQSSLAGTLRNITPPPSPRNTHSRPRGISTAKDCQTNSQIGERLAEGVPSPLQPSSPDWSQSLHRQFAPSAVEMTFFPVHSLNVIQTTALLSPVTPTQKTKYTIDGHGGDESVTLYHEGKRDKRTAQITEARFEKKLQLPDQSSAGSPHLKDNTKTRLNSGVAQCGKDPENNNRPHASDASDTYLLEASLRYEDPVRKCSYRPGSASGRKDDRGLAQLRHFSEGEEEVFC